MTKREWHKGPPPHIGWWNASTANNPEMWRWWNGQEWSSCADHYHIPEEVMRYASTRAGEQQHRIEWTNYWPENARVPRVDPTQEVHSTKLKPTQQNWRKAYYDLLAEYEVLKNEYEREKFAHTLLKTNHRTLVDRYNKRVVERAWDARTTVDDERNKRTYLAESTLGLCLLDQGE